ncbi:MAG: hypothetical protein A2020_13020 [Lentisphaerae bacterium GWF2_45_14]|nr:MAG: hypothetical protein A2020_13020 [Lentisphaerae bacterium GWF2_45_14]
MLLLCLAAAAGCVQQQQGKSENIIAHWTFDDASDNKIKDASGKHDGMVKGDKTGEFIRKGLYGNAAIFGKGRNTVVIPHSDELSLADDFSIECVIKPFSVDFFNTIIWKGSRNISPEEINYFVDIKNGRLELKTKDKAGNWSVYSTRKPVIEKNKWHDIIITYKQGQVNIYVNGKKCIVDISEKEPAQNTLLANEHEVTIGAGANHIENSYFFNGLIDDIKISKGVNADISKGKQENFTKKVVENEITGLENKSSEIIDAARKLKNLMNDGGSQDNNEILNSLLKVYEKGLTANESLLEEFNKQIGIMEYKNYYISSFGEEKNFALTVLPTYERLVKKTTFFKDIKNLKNDISLSLARNEREGFQAILLGSPFGDVNDVKVSVEDLRNENGKDTIRSKNIEWAPIASIETAPPEIDVDFVGKIPDAIMEGGEKINVARNDFTPVFFRIFADKETVPGNYKGRITFSCDGVSQELILNVKVYDFTLPEKNSLVVGFTFFESFYQKWYGYKTLTDEQKMGIYKFLLKYRIPPNNIYSGGGCYPEIEFLEKLADKGADFCTLKSLGGKGLRSEKEINEVLEKYRKNINKLKAANLYKYTYFYGYDELDCHSDSLDSAKQIMPRIMNEFPDLRLMQTSFPNPDIAGLFNVWVPLFAYFTSEQNLKILDKMRKKPNAEIWWYNADFPRKPFPNYFIDYPVFDCRIIMTLSYMYKVQGILYWSINREWKTNDVQGNKWPQIPWKPYIFNINNGARKYVNGMGNMVYPGADGQIYPSLRLENLRDGVEDYEYLKLLERQTAILKQSGRSPALVQEAEPLLRVPADVATAVNNYSADPQKLIDYRLKVAVLIEKINKALK